MNEFKTYEMEIKIDRDNKIVFFEENYPTCMDIPEIMNRISFLYYKNLDIREVQ